MMTKRFAPLIYSAVAALTCLSACSGPSSPPQAAAAANDSEHNMIIQKASAHDAVTTIDRLENILNAKGLTIFTRVSHSAGAKKVGIDMAASELIIFGNPKLGTPLMIENPQMGLDLPLKALAYTDEAGKTFLTYTAPSALQSRYGITKNTAVIEKMTGALDAMTNKAVEAE